MADTQKMLLSLRQMLGAMNGGLTYVNDEDEIRPCGTRWEFCNGKCSECPKANAAVSTRSEP